MSDYRAITVHHSSPHYVVAYISVPSTCCEYVQQVLQEIGFLAISVRQYDQCLVEIGIGFIWLHD